MIMSLLGNKQANLIPIMTMMPLFLNILSARGLSSSSSALGQGSTSSPPPWMEAGIQATDILQEAQSVLFVTGAGISAESGLPTYRGVSGLYNDGGSALQEDGMPIEQCLSGRTYRQNPQLTWKYLLQIERACRGAEPSMAHTLVAAMERYIPNTCVMTQNVDGLHDRAGSSNVLSLHGKVHTLVCTSCHAKRTVESLAEFEGIDGTFPPVCDECGGSTIRPAVVLFDEYLGDDTVQTYEKMMNMSMMNLMWGGGTEQRPPTELPFDVAISIGTSALFPYVNAAALAGRTTIEINPCETPLSSMVDVRIPAGASEALEFIFSRLGWDIPSSSGVKRNY